MAHKYAPFVIQDSIDKTSVRALDTDGTHKYTNNTGRTLIVSVTVAFRTFLVDDIAEIDGHAGTQKQCWTGLFSPAVAQQTVLSLTLFVKPGLQYWFEKVVIGQGVAVLQRWQETF